MTKEELVSKLDTWYNTWGTDSNATSNQGELFEIGDRAIAEFKQILSDADGHPDPPPPRIHP